MEAKRFAAKKILELLNPRARDLHNSIESPLSADSTSQATVQRTIMSIAHEQATLAMRSLPLTLSPEAITELFDSTEREVAGVYQKEWFRLLHALEELVLCDQSLSPA